MMANIYCCSCERSVLAISIIGRQAYPKIPKIAKRIFWQCPHCKQFVGSHKRNGKPLGCIPTQKLKRMRQNVHAVLDPLYKGGMISRSQLYKMMAEHLGIGQYHTAELRSEAEAKQAWIIAMQIRDELTCR